MPVAPRYFSGSLLLAMPGMGDPRFDKAVIALVVHDEHGAIGIGIGHHRPDIRLRALLRQLEIEPSQDDDRPVLHGGPVETGRGFVLHSDDWGGQDTIHVGGLGAMTGTIDVLRAIAEGRGPARWKVALGYAGWSAGQLEEEMTRHGWFVAPGSAALLFDTPTEAVWERAFKGAGIDPRLLTCETGMA